MECYSDFDVKPTIGLTDNAFKVALPNSNFSNGKAVKLDLSYRENQVLGLFETMEIITRKDVEQALKISQATAILLLRRMTEKNLLEKNGQGKNLRYITRH